MSETYQVHELTLENDQFVDKINLFVKKKYKLICPLSYDSYVFTFTVHYVIFFFVMKKENGTKIFSRVIFSVRMVSNEP